MMPTGIGRMAGKSVILVAAITVTALLIVAPATLMILRLHFYSPGRGTTVISVNIENGAMTPSQLVTEEGEPITLRLNADRHVDFRVEGLARTPLPPGNEVTAEFEAENAGRYKVWDDLTQERLGTLLVESQK